MSLKQKEMAPLIAIEGIDGAGKTTVVQHLRERIPSAVVTYEPHDEMMTGEAVRWALARETHPATDALLFAADHIEHVRRIILPALQDGHVVICDRSPVSMFAYQPARLRVAEPISWLESLYSDGAFWPNVTIYLDVDVETGLDRSGQNDKYETTQYLESVLRNYRDMPASLPFQTEWISINGTAHIDDVMRRVTNELDDIPGLNL